MSINYQPPSTSFNETFSSFDANSISNDTSFSSNPDVFERTLSSTERTSPPLLCYPIDLGESPEHQFMIRFDIYVTGGATLSQQRSRQDAVYSAIQQSVVDAGGSLSVGQFVGLAASAGEALLGTATSAFGGYNGSGIPNTGQQGRKRDSFVEETTGLSNLTEYEASVYMYLPGNISIKYKFDYEDADLTSLDILRGLRSLTETQTGSGSVAQAEIARKMGMSAIKVGEDVLELVGGKDVFTKNQQAMDRQITNPFVVHLFKGVGRRTFNFSFTMIPRSEKEAQTIENIVTTFRKYGHPKRSDGGRFLDFPAEFDIAFLHGGNDNLRIPKIRKCALTGINLSYGESVFTGTVKDSQGKISPTKITLDLEFSELELLTQQSITEQGA